MIESINSLLEKNHLDEAVALCDVLLMDFPRNSHVLYLKGLGLRKKGDLAAAKTNLEFSLQFEPDNVDAQFALGNVLRVSGDTEAAVAAYKKLLQLAPKHEKAFFNLGLVHQMAGKTKEALAYYQQALEVNPGYAEALNNMGNVLKSLGNIQAAYESYSKAVTIKPSAQTYYNIALVLQMLKRHADAVEAYYCAIKHNPQYMEAWNGLGLAFHKLGKFSQAVEAFKRAILLNPENAQIYNNLGISYKQLKQLEPAIECFERCVEIDPDFSDALGSLIQNKLHACNWKNIDEIYARIERTILQGKAFVPFNILATPLSADIQKKCAVQYTAVNFPAAKPLTDSNTRYEHDKIRIGYFSADLHNHATAYLMADLFEQHDREDFEIHAFSFGPTINDEMGSRVRKAFDVFHEVGKKSDREIAQLVHQMEIDIAVDLKGYTRGARPGIFTYSPAPIQVSYLGYPSTLGAPYIHYLIADGVLIPEQSREHYTEKIAYMPDTYQVNAKRKVLPQDAASKTDHGLPEDAFVFCCFNNNYKITPDVFAIWLRLLQEIEHAVLWLFEANPSATLNLKSRAHAEGISPDRLIFAKKVPQEMHLARYHHADIVLDTFHYNAHTTTSDALWVGCPVLTCLGSAFPGRVAASILDAFGMPELITTSHDAYFNLAKQLALDTNRLKAIRQKVAAHKDTQPLFNIDRYTNHIEQLYLQMYQLHQKGLPPEHLYS